MARATANLAIEIGDPGRMAKARRIHRKGGVAGVDVMARSVTATVVDGDESFEVDLLLGDNTARGVLPQPEDLTGECTCGESDGKACIHVLAAMLGLAEAFETNARLLDEWTDAPGEIAPNEVLMGDGDFFGNPGQHTSIVALGARRPVEFPSLGVDEVAAGPVFEDAIEAIRRTITPYRARQ